MTIGNQTEPSCPRCRERMSKVERGLGGVWSCIYCEGVWLPGESPIGAAAEPVQPLSENSLLCPRCVSPSLAGKVVQGHQFFQCLGCAGAFLPKGVIQAICPEKIQSQGQADVPELMLTAIASSLLLLPELLLIKLKGPKSPSERG